jgi:hypothetical protein
MTKDEAKAKFKECFPDYHAVKVYRQSTNSWKMEIDLNRLALPMLIKLSKLVGTEDINEEHFHQDGCESCDYGSRDWYELTITDPKDTEVLEALKK